MLMKNLVAALIALLVSLPAYAGLITVNEDETVVFNFDASSLIPYDRVVFEFEYADRAVDNFGSFGDYDIFVFSESGASGSLVDSALGTFPSSVITGMLSGIGVIIILKQIKT